MPSERGREQRLSRVRSSRMYLICFFFQAEDGIRDLTVTRVQTCALPISTTQRRLDRETKAVNDPKRRRRYALPAHSKFYFDDAIASSKISSATSTFSRFKIRGGDQRIVFGPAPSKIRPRSKLAISTRSRSSGSGFFDERSVTNSTPSIIHMPRTSPIQSCLSISFSSPLFK